MNAVNSIPTNGAPSQTLYRALAATLAIVVLIAFGGERLLYETTGTTVNWPLRYVLSGTVLTVGVSAFYASAHDNDVTTSVLVASGPIVGLALYLLGYHLVLPPSTDSPTWLIFLIWAVGYVGVGLVGHLVGRLVRKASRRTS